jgi:hypothetical protein
MTAIPAPTAGSTEPTAAGLRRWMRGVGAFYLLVALFNTPPAIAARFPVQYGWLDLEVGAASAQALIDVWFMFGLEVGVVGLALLLSARDPRRHVALVWTVLGLELVRGVADDLYLLVRGYDLATYVTWIAIHAVVIATGLRALHRADALPRRNRARRPTAPDQRLRSSR